LRRLIAPTCVSLADSACEGPRLQTQQNRREHEASNDGDGERGASYEGAMSIAPGVWLYQVSGDSLALELTARGTKYYKDSDLN
jgi:hypothetical protein